MQRELELLLRLEIPPGTWIPWPNLLPRSFASLVSKTLQSKHTAGSLLGNILGMTAMVFHLLQFVDN